MDITEVRIKLMEDPGERLKAFCSITFDDCFVVRDLKIIEGSNGPFVAMPSRKLTFHCPQCGCKNHLRAAHCNHCGLRLKDDRAIKDAEGRAKLYADIAHPINSGCREMIQNRVVDEFHLEQDRAKKPGYVSRYDDFDIDDVVPAPKHTPRAEQPPLEKSTVEQPSAEQPASEETAPVDAPRVQLPIEEPRAPHHAPPTPPSTKSDGDRSTGTGFGAGIL